MKDITQHTHQATEKHLDQTDFDFVDIIHRPNFPPETVYTSTGKLNIPYLLKNGDILFEAREYPLARKIYKTVLNSGECSGTALNRLARCFEAEGAFEEAQTSYEESICYNPTLDSYQRLVSLLIRQNRDHEAAKLLERALHLKDLPQSVRFELHKACGNCWTRAHNHEEAEKHFIQALAIHPTADDIRSNLGALYLQNNKISEAKRHFQDAIASNYRNHHALSGLGSCILAEGNPKKAHDYFAQALEIELNNPTAVFYLIRCAYEIKSYSKAAHLLQNYIGIAPVSANLLYSLAGLQYHLGRIEESKSNSLKILELQPEHTGAKDLLHLLERYAGSSLLPQCERRDIHE